MLSAAEFRRQFFEESDDLKKIKLAVREGQFDIWQREDQENLEAEFLDEILDLPENHPVQRKPRISGGPGDDEVVVLKYVSRKLGRPFPIYLKAYFEYDKVSLSLEVQSLKEDVPLKIIPGGNNNG